MSHPGLHHTQKNLLWHWFTASHTISSLSILTNLIFSTSVDMMSISSISSTVYIRMRATVCWIFLTRRPDAFPEKNIRRHLNFDRQKIPTSWIQIVKTTVMKGEMSVDVE